MSKVFELGIIGLGPSGIGAAMSLRGTHLIGETVCFEHGASLGNNRCSLLANKECCQWTPCHVVSGIGGSSNNSSGKISDYPAGSGLVPFFESEAHLKSMLSSLIETLERDIGLKKVNIESDIINLTEDYYRSKNITYKYYDVYEFDGIKYRQYISEIIDTLVSEGLCVKMNTEITNLEYDRDTALYTVTAKTESKETQYSCRKIILGTGSMRLFEGLIQTLVGKQANSYEIGVRVEGPTEAFKHT